MNDAKPVTQNFVAVKPAKLKRGVAETLLLNHENDMYVGGEAETRPFLILKQKMIIFSKLILFCRLCFKADFVP